MEQQLVYKNNQQQWFKVIVCHCGIRGDDEASTVASHSLSKPHVPWSDRLQQLNSSKTKDKQNQLLHMQWTQHDV